MDALKEFNSTIHGGIIFDDMSFAHYPRETQIHLLDMQDDSQIHIRYTIAKIPAYTRKIFTTNKKVWEIFLFQDEAIQRRITVWEMESPQVINLIDAVAIINNSGRAPCYQGSN